MTLSASIVGVGTTGVGRFPDRTALSLAADAVADALRDSGLERSQIDGLVSHIGSPRGIDYDLLAASLGLNVCFAAQPWSHGRFGATVLQHAAMAVSSGMAKYVLCIAAYRNSPIGLVGGRHRWGFDEALRDGGGPHAETPYAGLAAPIGGAAMATQRYFHKYGAPLERLMAVPLAMRRHARLTPGALMQKNMTAKDYLNAPFIVEPLRLFDCSINADGAVALIVTKDERASDGPNIPVKILGMQGVEAGPNVFIFGQEGLGINQADVFDQPHFKALPPVYRMAQLEPNDIDLLQVYDAFSPLVLFTLERFGFCGAGEAIEWVQNGRIELGGQLPVNTSGGMLSEGHLNGWNQFVEIVRQLRGEASGRQVADAKIAQWGTALGDSIIFASGNATGDRTR